MADDAQLGPRLEAVLREGTRPVQDLEARLAELDTAIARGVTEADAGNTRPAREVFAELRVTLGASAPTP